MYKWINGISWFRVGPHCSIFVTKKVKEALKNTENIDSAGHQMDISISLLDREQSQ